MGIRSYMSSWLPAPLPYLHFTPPLHQLFKLFLALEGGGVSFLFDVVIEEI
jgi:hypothetical protein